MTGSPICSMPEITKRDIGSVMRMLAIAIAMLATAGTAKAAEIHAFISTALKTVTDELIRRSSARAATPFARSTRRPALCSSISQPASPRTFSSPGARRSTS